MDSMRVIATFHPAYLLRSPEKKREVWEDMKQIRAELFRLRS
jgi:DNA polymerase